MYFLIKYFISFWHKILTLPISKYNENKLPHPINGNKKGIVYPIIYKWENPKAKNLEDKIEYHFYYVDSYYNIPDTSKKYIKIGFWENIIMCYKWEYNWRVKEQKRKKEFKEYKNCYTTEEFEEIKKSIKEYNYKTYGWGW